VRVAPIVNHWYGQVTVSGLLTGRDVIDQLGTPGPDEIVLLPRVMFDYSAQVTLDDMTTAQIQEALGKPVAIAQHPAHMLAALRGETSYPPPAPVEEPGWWGEPYYSLLAEAD
jgi:NifB/MoaA-like Fe-S oxidoreductase